MVMSRSVFINAGAIVLLPSAPEGGNTDDLMNSVLLAQLVANKSLLRKPPADWYDTYVKVLSDYWVSSLKSRQDLLPVPEGTASPLEWIAAMPLGELGDERRAVMESLGCVARLPGSLPAMDILHGHVQKQHESAEQSCAQPRPVRLMVVVAQPPASMTCLYLQFSTLQAVDPNPWAQRFASKDLDGCVSVRYFQAHLSEILYAPARKFVARKVEAATGANIADISGAVSALGNASVKGGSA